MKVIDLLNKIAKGEKVPKEIIYNNREFEFDELERCYCYHNEDYSINEDLSMFLDGLKQYELNEEVELLEENK